MWHLGWGAQGGHRLHPSLKVLGRKFFLRNLFQAHVQDRRFLFAQSVAGMHVFYWGQRVMRSIAKRMSVLEGKLPVRQHHQVAATACTCSLHALSCPQVALKWVQLGWLQGEESNLLEPQVQEQGMISSEKTRGGCFRGRPKTPESTGAAQHGARSAARTSGQGKEGHPSVSPPLATRPPPTVHQDGKQSRGTGAQKSERQVAQ